MCEILVTRGQRRFSCEAYEGAESKNDDGAGVLILQKKKDRQWLLEDLTHFPPEYVTKTAGNWEGMEPGYGDDEMESGYGDDGMEPSWNTFGGGVWGPPYTQKIKHAGAIYEKQKKLKKDQIMIAHFRFATSGHSVQNTQPIVDGRWVVVHNGVFGYSDIPEGLSDTAHFVWKLEKKTKKMGSEEKAIDATLAQAGGYWSVFLYSTATQRLYYRISDQASFYWQRGLGSTKTARFPIDCARAINDCF
jgi:hypothetical protein